MGKREDTIWVAAWPHGETLESAVVEAETFPTPGEATVKAIGAAVRFTHETGTKGEAMVLAVHLPWWVRLLKKHDDRHEWALKQVEKGNVRVVMEVK